MIQPTQIFPATFKSGSDVYSSRGLAAYQIGRPDGARMALYNVTEKEAHEIMTNLPEELLEVVKVHYNLVPIGTVVVDSQISKDTAFLVGEPIIVESEPVELKLAVFDPEPFKDPADDWLDETPAPKPETEEAVDLNELTLEELKDLARELKMTGYSKYKADDKPVLINLIEEELKKIDDVNDEDGL